MKKPQGLRKDHMSFRTNELMNLQEATQSGNFGSDSQEEIPNASSPMLKGRSMEAHSQLHASIQPNLKHPTSAAYNGLNVLKSHRSNLNNNVKQNYNSQLYLNMFKSFQNYQSQIQIASANQNVSGSYILVPDAMEHQEESKNLEN